MSLTEKLEKLTEEELANLYKKTFISVEAQLVIEDLKNRCFVKTTPFAVKDSVTNFNTGMQSVVLHIESQLKYKPKQEGEE